MPSRLVNDKKRYLYAVYVGESDTLFGKLWCKLKKWYYRIDRWDEGEILRRYYELTRRDDDEDYIISVSKKSF